MNPSYADVKPTTGSSVGKGCPGTALKWNVFTSADVKRKKLFLVNGSPKHIRLPNNNKIREKSNYYVIIRQEFFLITNAKGDVIFILNDLCHVNVQMSFRTEAMRIFPGIGVVKHGINID